MLPNLIPPPQNFRALLQLHQRHVLELYYALEHSVDLDYHPQTTDAMANPRQRSKAKSHKHTKPSLHEKRRLHQKLRRAPPLKGPEVLQHGWDKKKTVFQKYV